MRSKAKALEEYYRQARNVEAERMACNVRLRAERRSGELLAELARATPSEAGAQGGRGNKSVSNDETSFSASPYSQALIDNEIPRQTAHRYQQLAAIPKEEFEAALADPVGKPSTAGLIAQARDPVPKVGEDALWVWGRVGDPRYVETGRTRAPLTPPSGGRSPRRFNARTARAGAWLAFHLHTPSLTERALCRPSCALCEV